MKMVYGMVALACSLLVLGEAPLNAQEKVSPAGKDAPTIQPAPIPGPAIRNPGQLLDERIRLPDRPPEPTGVYGWIAIVDPTTGQKWLPEKEETGRVGGYPSAIHVRFEPVFGGTPVTVSYMAAAGIEMDSARNAWRYAIAFDHVPTMTGPPAKTGSAGVRYNPAQWRFAGLEIGPYNHDQRTAEGNLRLWTVDFGQRSIPFGDLPDISPVR